MKEVIRHKILIVDDDPGMRDALCMQFLEEGFAVAAAVHGLDALMQLRLEPPEVIISNLNMPQMSGFELLFVVRRRFPSIRVIAMSDAYEPCGHFPRRVIADRFYLKDRSHPVELLSMVGELIETVPTRPPEQEHQPARIQMPRYGTDAHGMPFALLTCTDCMRTFSINQEQKAQRDIRQATCQFCATAVRYVSGFPFLVGSSAVLAASQTIAASTYCN